MSNPLAIDLYLLQEDERIDMIGGTAGHCMVGVALESDQPEKIERYKLKIAQRYPDVKLYDESPGVPTSLTTMLRFGPKQLQ